MNTIIPPCKVGDCYLAFGPVFGHLAPYLDQNIGAGNGFLDPRSEAGVINLNTGNKFMVETGRYPCEHYARLVRQLSDEHSHIPGESQRMQSSYLVIKDGKMYGMV